MWKEIDKLMKDKADYVVIDRDESGIKSNSTINLNNIRFQHSTGLNYRDGALTQTNQASLYYVEGISSGLEDKIFKKNSKVIHNGTEFVIDFVAPCVILSNGYKLTKVTFK